LRPDGTLQISILDTIGWWSEQAAEALAVAGHGVAVLTSFDDLSVSAAMYDVVIYACAALAPEMCDGLAQLARSAKILIVVAARIDVPTTSALFERGIAAVAGRYDPPAAIAGTIEHACRLERSRRTRRQPWSIPA
jgi:hypothetical protein